ncbi:MAG: hypothetical protein GY859_35735 [Desulfobacterales bacterium]|nr:hypothetical protein [Desulfobacterales bacterium]
MAGMVEFFTEVGENQELAADFIGVIGGPTPDTEEILTFFKNNDYADVGLKDVKKLIDQRNNLKENYGIGENADY